MVMMRINHIVGCLTLLHYTKILKLRDRNRIVVGFTTTCAIRAYHH
jgi:hypothetical protein